MKATKRLWIRTAVGAAAAAALMGSAWAQETLKIGLLANLEGPFAVPGQDGYRGADMALKEKNGMAGGKKIEFVKVSSDATPDKAVAMTRKAVEQDKVQIMIGPLSGDEGIAVKNYAKTKPDITFINGSSRNSTFFGRRHFLIVWSYWWVVSFQVRRGNETTSWPSCLSVMVTRSPQKSVATNA